MTGWVRGGVGVAEKEDAGFFKSGAPGGRMKGTYFPKREGVPDSKKKEG